MKTKPDRGKKVELPQTVPINPTIQSPVLRVESTHTTEKFQGPLPHPEILRGYEQIQPGIAGVFIEQFRNESEHRRSTETRALDADIEILKSRVRIAERGQLYSTAISLAAITAATILGIYGQPWLAGAFGVTGLAGFLRAALQSRNNAPNEKDQG